MRNVAMLALILCACTRSADTDVGDTDLEETDDTEVVDDGLFDLRLSLELAADDNLPVGSVRAQLMPLTFRGDEPWEFGVPITESAVSGAAVGTSTEVLLRFNPEPDESTFFEAEDGLEIAPFGVGFYVDMDGNEVRGPSDPLVGASYSRIVAYLRGTLPPGYVEAGALIGWNVVDISSIDGATKFAPIADDALSDLVVHGNLLLADPSDLVMTVNATSDAACRVGLWNLGPQVDETMPMPADPTLVSMPADLSESGAKITFPSLPKPPTDHYTKNLEDLPADFVDAAIYIAIAWTETSGDEDFNPGEDGDQVVQWSAYDQDNAQLVLHLVPLRYEAAGFSEVLGWKMGWFMLRSTPDSPDGYLVPWEDGIAIGTAL
jgi:hypothetical protein